MPSTNSSWAAVIAAHHTNAKAEKGGQSSGVYAAFIKLCCAYTSFPLRASPKDIWEANHLMLH